MPPSNPPISLRQSLTRALKHRNYRLFFSGQTVSLIGTWLTRVATSWLVYRLSHSATALGVVSFAGQLPTFLLAPVAGVYVDRWNRHRVLVITQVLAMLQSAALAFFTLTGTINVPIILVLSICQGLINAFDMPARQSFLIEMIDDRADLQNAIALNSSMVNLARLLGPSVAGILIAVSGEGGCFTIDAISYLAVIASLLMMHLKPRATVPSKGRRMIEDLREGYSYVSSFRPIRFMLLLLSLVSFMGIPYTVLLPLFVSEKLHGGPNTLGYLMAAAGLGALAGALYLASRRSVIGLVRMIAITSCLFGLGLIGFGFSTSLALSLVAMVATGMGMMMQMASTNTLLQTIADEDKRGRVMSFYTMAFVGMSPFGALFAGVAADHVGPTATIVFGGATCLLGGLLFWRALPEIREQVRPVYVRLGILPEIASGINEAAELRQEH